MRTARGGACVVSECSTISQLVTIGHCIIDGDQRIFEKSSSKKLFEKQNRVLPFAMRALSLIPLLLAFASGQLTLPDPVICTPATLREATGAEPSCGETIYAYKAVGSRLNRSHE